MSAQNTYLVSLPAEADGPEETLRTRFEVIAAFRLGSLERRTGHYPEVGGAFDMLDCLEGKYLWEMSDQEIADRPPTRIDFEVVSVEPATKPPTPSEVRVVVRLPR